MPEQAVPFTQLFARPLFLLYPPASSDSAFRVFVNFFAPALVESRPAMPNSGRAAMRSEKQARRFFIVGRVQGVGYRYFAMNAAEQIGVTGYAKNLADGRVEVYAIGTSAQLRDFARELQRGPALAAVANVAEVEAELLPDLSAGFSVTFDR
jgi:acylphosphatase